MTNYNNIPASKFNSLQPEFTTEMLMVSFRTRDRIVLSAFAIFQILAGLKHLEKNHEWSSDPFDVLKLAGLLYSSAMAPRRQGEECELEVTRADVKTMIEMLNLRMAHCERERDNESPNFNADTYIGQKLLLIELREWMLLEQVTVPTERALAHD